MNWYAGWWLILAGFASGAVIGLFFHRADFLGGYASFRRRMLRLGHIACAALGMLNLLVAIGVRDIYPGASLFIIGGVTMPVVCFLTAWKENCRHLFFIPVLTLLAAVVLTLCGRDGPPGRPQSTEAARPVVAPYQEEKR
jgi:hypothetical protein